MRAIFSLFLLSFFGLAQASSSDVSVVLADSFDLPKVFILGQYEKAYDKLYESHSTVLLEVVEDDMDEAFNEWIGMLKAMEAYAKRIDYDIKGIKVWLNIFWNEDGSIKHIAYHLKVNSRNIDQAELSAFFSSFMNNYIFPVVNDKPFSHYASASFPIFAIRVIPQKEEMKKDDGESVNKKKPNLIKDSGRSKKY